MEKDTEIILSLLESTRIELSFDAFFSTTAKNSFSKLSLKVVRRCRRVGEQNSDHFSGLKYLINSPKYQRYHESRTPLEAT